MAGLRARIPADRADALAGMTDDGGRRHDPGGHQQLLPRRRHRGVALVWQYLAQGDRAGSMVCDRRP